MPKDKPSPKNPQLEQDAKTTTRPSDQELRALGLQNLLVNIFPIKPLSFVTSSFRQISTFIGGREA